MWIWITFALWFGRDSRRMRNWKIQFYMMSMNSIVKSNPHLPSGLFHPYEMDESISNFRGVSCIFSFLFHFWLNSADSDQKPHLIWFYFLPGSPQKDARLISWIWVNEYMQIIIYKTIVISSYTIFILFPFWIHKRKWAGNKIFKFFARAILYKIKCM